MLFDVIAFIIATIGYYFNGKPKLRSVSYILWIISNSYWAFNSNNIWMMFMFITRWYFGEANMIYCLELVNADRK